MRFLFYYSVKETADEGLRAYMYVEDGDVREQYVHAQKVFCALSRTLLCVVISKAISMAGSKCEIVSSIYQILKPVLF